MKSIKFGNQVARRDIVLWCCIGLILVAIIIANDYFISQPLPIRLIAWVIAILLLMALFFGTSLGHRFWLFLQASRAELRKVVWPTRQETVRTTVLVMVMVVISGLFLWCIDSLLLRLVAFLTV